MSQLIRLGTKQIADNELRRINVPTSLIWGAHDRMVPLALAQRATELFGWPLHTIPDAAHVPHMEQRVKFAEALQVALGDQRHDRRRVSATYD
jgi:pimeloyl-ACP methyl ester carboxylesterase